MEYPEQGIIIEDIDRCEMLTIYCHKPQAGKNKKRKRTSSVFPAPSRLLYFAQFFQKDSCRQANVRCQCGYREVGSLQVTLPTSCGSCRPRRRNPDRKRCSCKICPIPTTVAAMVRRSRPSAWPIDSLSIIHFNTELGST